MLFSPVRDTVEEPRLQVGEATQWPKMSRCKVAAKLFQYICPKDEALVRPKSGFVLFLQAISFLEKIFFETHFAESCHPGALLWILPRCATITKEACVSMFSDPNMKLKKEFWDSPVCRIAAMRSWQNKPRQANVLTKLARCHFFGSFPYKRTG